MVKSSKKQIEGRDVHVRRLLRHAEDMLEKGDRLQASEKAWGAFSRQMKILAKVKGWKSGPSTRLEMLASKADALAHEELGLKEGKVYLLFNTTKNLHTSFYRDTDPIPMIRRKIERTKQLIDILQKLGGDGDGGARGGGGKGNGGNGNRRRMHPEPRKSPQLKRAEELGSGNGGRKPPKLRKSPQLKRAEELGSGNGGRKPPKLRKPPQRLRTGTVGTGRRRPPKPRKSPQLKGAEELRERYRLNRELRISNPVSSPDTPVMTQAQLDRLRP